ncbi:kynurenine formamidase isoform X1 [Grus americana]|uniref:kynurenine formamidase isoform X1 n=1 Tax=Grus americana TaxID=9117 RepID=UPI00240822B6|nr:kynurenine formamidase isoform X1 [Grus americana]
MGGWRDMTAEALEEQYSPSRWSPRLGRDAVIQAHLAATAAGTQRARAGAQTSLHVPYGDGEREKLDVYFPTDPSGTFPVLVYIHGGYWQCLRLVLRTLGLVGVPAGPRRPRPRGLASFCFPPVKTSRDSRPPRWCRGAWGWWQWVTTQPPKATWTPWCCRCGAASPSWRSSTPASGAHLAAMVLSTDWTEYGVVPDIKGAVLVSGVYDLEPILHTYVNDALNMSREVARRNSPMLCVSPAAPAACEVLVAMAQHDSPEFRRQSQEYGQALRAAGWSVSLLDLAGVDHFDIIEKLSEESFVLTQVILNMISRA